MLKYNIYKKKNFFIKNKNYNCLIIIKEKKNFIIFNKIVKSKFYPEEKKNNKNIVSCIYNMVGERIFHIKKCGIVTRLDLETKGIFLFLKKDIKIKIIKKKYFVISKCFKRKDFFLKGFLKKKKNKMIFCKKKTKYPVQTKFYIKNIKKNNVLIICVFKHGKTHQIRSSLKYLSIKILGDKKYGLYNKKYLESNLHSWNLIFKIKQKLYNFYSFPNKIFIKYYKFKKFKKKIEI